MFVPFFALRVKYIFFFLQKMFILLSIKTNTAVYTRYMYNYIVSDFFVKNIKKNWEKKNKKKKSRLEDKGGILEPTFLALLVQYLCRCQFILTEE